jgi:hypothetical protein
MTSALAIIGLQASRSDIGLVDLQRPDLSLFLEITEGLDGGLQVRGTDDLVPFRSGRLPVPRIPDARPIGLTGRVTDTEASPLVGFRTGMDELLRIFDPIATTPDDPLILIATLEDGSIRWIRTWSPNVLAPDQPDQPRGVKTVSVECQALDAYWYGVWGIATLDSGLLRDSGLLLDGSAPLAVSPADSPHLTTFEALGNASTERVAVTLTGPSVGPVGIEYVPASGDPIGFIMTDALGALDVLVVDNFGRTCLLNGVGVRGSMTLSAGNQHGEYLRLPAGPCTLRIWGQPTSASVLFTPAYN